ncbi:MAG: hypothetical protein ACREV5_03635 [Steroidobacter sp.]
MRPWRGQPASSPAGPALIAAESIDSDLLQAFLPVAYRPILERDGRG